MKPSAHRAKPAILVCMQYYLPGNKSGGPARTLANLINATHDDFDYLVVTRDRDLGDEAPYPGIDPVGWNTVGAARVRYVSAGRQGLRQIARVIRETPFDVLYLNSFFSTRFGIWPQWCNRGPKKPVVLGPRGQFSEGAFGLKAFRKKVYSALYKLSGAHKKVVWQASTTHERHDIRRVMGPAVTVLEAENIASRQYAESLPGKDPGQLKVVFLSRISPMKNLDYALRVLRQIDFRLQFDIYGPAENEQYWLQCQALIDQLPANVTVNIHGAVPSVDVPRVLARYDLLFLPTKGENYGHVIAEALCAGVPLLIANTTPWRNLATHDIGWDLALSDPTAFAARLIETHQMSVTAHHDMRQRVRQWARERFEKQDAVAANRKLFSTVLTRLERP